MIYPPRNAAYELERLAVRQNNHDMLMTAEELRWCEAILEETK